MITVGLRIDVDTFRGTRDGVPNLCRLFNDYGITGSFFFSVGPDNMGRHLWRLIRPSFLAKMMRSNAASLYGWDILLKGTFWPGPMIGEKLPEIIRAASDAGHEIGLHAYDHHAWQAKIDTMSGNAIYDELNKGIQMLTRILGRAPICSAVPGWKCNDLVLMEKSKFPFAYNSDCRGENIFRPLVSGKEISQPQIPVTLPTYDEVIGRNGISDKNYNEYLLSLIQPDRRNVLTIHAEAEGIACLPLFEQFLKMCRAKEISFVPLGALLKASPELSHSTLIAKEIQGREGWVACQDI
jgi:undecaprenyl phosphate-alpha-L-ara4FN deformylase